VLWALIRKLQAHEPDLVDMVRAGVPQAAVLDTDVSCRRLQTFSRVPEALRKWNITREAWIRYRQHTEKRASDSVARLRALMARSDTESGPRRLLDALDTIEDNSARFVRTRINRLLGAPNNLKPTRDKAMALLEQLALRCARWSDPADAARIPAHYRWYYRWEVLLAHIG